MNPIASSPGNLTLADNLNRLVALRWFVISGCAALLLLANAGIELVNHSTAAWLILLNYALINAGLKWWLSRRQGIHEWLFLANLALDLVLIWLFLRFSGGSANPFTLLFLLPVIVAAATLRPAAIWLLTGLSIAAYTLLLWLTPEHHNHTAMQSSFSLHLLGMWLGLVFSAGLVAYFVTGMGRALRNSEAQLARAREQALRDERVIALGAMAAGAAHELGTPLASMNLLVDELQSTANADQAAQAQLQLLKAQIQRCKKVLSGLSAHGHELHAEAGQAMTARQLLDAVLQRWRQQRPDASVKLQWQGDIPEARLLADETLFQSLCSLLNNAADASSETIELSARLQDDVLWLDIQDHGPGISQSIAGRIGREPVTGKSAQQGLGIGLLLASSVIERLGGEVTHRSAAAGGTVASVSLPLNQLMVDKP